MNTIVKISDVELIENLKQPAKIDASIKSIYKECYTPLSRFIISNNGSPEDAEDVFQEVIISFIMIVQKGKFKGESSIKTFLSSINRHIWLNELRKRQMKQAFLRNPMKFKSIDDTGILAIIDERESHREIMLLLDQLSEVCKQVLMLYYYNNLSIKEIKQRLALSSEKLVRNKKYKCLKKLNELATQSSFIKTLLTEQTSTANN